MRTAVFLSALFLATSAQAAPIDKVNKLMEQGKPDQAILLAQRYLEKTPGDATMTAAMEKAYFLYAEQLGTLDAYRGFRNRYPDSDLAYTAWERMASMAWEEVAGSKDRAAIANYRRAYPNGPLDEVAAKAEANLAFRDAQTADTVESWKQFIDLFPKDPRAQQAQERMEFSALKAAREQGTIGALRAFLAAYPKSTRRGAVMRDILTQGTKFQAPCPGDPPTCNTLSKGTVLEASWDDLAAESITAELVAWSAANGPSPLRAAFAAWAGEGWGSQPAELADLLVGKTQGTSWRLELPVDLRRPGVIQDGYALRIAVEDAAPAVFPIVLREAWEPPRAGKMAVYPLANSIEVQTEGYERRTLVTLPEHKLDDPAHTRRVGSWFYAWGENGLVRVDLDTAAVDRLVQAQPVSNVWKAGEAVLFEARRGESASLKRVSADGTVTTIMPPPHRANAPDQFTTVAFAADVPVGIMFIKGLGWGVVPEIKEPRPLKTPDSVPKGGPTAAKVAVDPPGLHAAFFVEGRSPKVVVVTLDTGHAVTVDVPPAQFDKRSVFFDAVSWTAALGLLGKVADSDKAARIIGETVTVVPASTFPVEPPPERPADAPPEVPAFVYEPRLVSLLRKLEPVEEPQ